MKDISSFYLSYDGLTDPLGQSQVLPYVIGLRQKKGVRMCIFSFEKAERQAYVDNIREICSRNDIEWIPLTYTKRPPVISTIYDVFKLKRALKRVISSRKSSPDIIHCRGYITALAGLSFKKKLGTRFVFDMRGFFADERVDGALWDIKKPVFKKVYDYFKLKERQFFSGTDATISLTSAGKRIIEGMPGASAFAPITVIPCCADLAHFSRNNVDNDAVNKLKSDLGLDKSDFILTYLGSMGTWYMPEEMMDFFSVLLEYKPTASFLWITPDKPEDVYALAARKGIDKSRIVVRYAQRAELPNILSLSDFSIFFIKPAFSKQASSPTKMGELMGLGIPLICNSGVGDVDAILEDSKAGFLIRDFSSQSYHECCSKLEVVSENQRNIIVEGARKYYSLENGVERYFGVYEGIVNQG